MTTTPHYFAVGTDLYCDFGDGRLARYSPPFSGEFVQRDERWETVPAPDPRLLWPAKEPAYTEPAGMADAPTSTGIDTQCEGFVRNGWRCAYQALPHLRYCADHLPNRTTHPHLYKD